MSDVGFHLSSGEDATSDSARLDVEARVTTTIWPSSGSHDPTHTYS